MDAPIVVVGAGPVGLMLAGELSLGGAEVVVLERRDRPTTESRASTLHARSMEILDSRGLLAQFGAPPCEPRGHFGGIPLDLSLPGPFPGQWKIPQTRVEEVLAGWALGRGATVRRGWTVTEVADTGDRVEVVADTARGRQVVRAAYVVACDGQDSTVRALTRMPFPGVPARHTMLRADVTGVEVAARRFQRLPRGMAVAARNPAGVTRIMVHEFGGPVPGDGAAPGFAAVAGAWRRVTGEDISSGEPLWLNAFDDANRQVDRYRTGRVLFAGDAAHVQLPAGGQALNLGLQDAANLGWKLAGVVRGDTGPGLLDTYHDERHAVGRQVLANIRAQAELLLGDDSVEPVRALLGELLTREHNRTLLAGVISGTGLRYPPGPGDHPAVGSRVPGLDLRDGRGLLAGAGVRAYAGAWLDRVAVSGVECPVPGAAAALIRPDGHLAWAGSDPAAARAALTRWFGPARDRALTTTNGRKDLS